MKKQNSKRDDLIHRTAILYFGLMKKYWYYSAPAILASAIGTVLIFYVPPIIVGELIKTPSATIASSWQYLLWFAGSWMAGEILWRVAIFYNIKLSIVGVKQLYQTAFDDLIRKDIHFFHNRFAGTITKNIMAYGRRFEGFFDNIMFNITSDLLPVIFAAVILWKITPWLPVALIIVMILASIIVLPMVRKRMKLVKSREDASSLMAGHISDAVANISAVKSFGAEKDEVGIHNLQLNDFINKAKRSWNYQNSPIDMTISPIYVLANVIGLFIVLQLGVDASTKANLFIGYSYFANITRFLWSFNSVYRNLETSLTEASLFVAYEDELPTVIDIENASSMKVNGGKLAFEKVSFKHFDKSSALFSGLSFEIQSGEKVGVIGYSGAGKSTIVNLLLRFMNIDSGRIIIDGQDISRVTQESLHKSIAYVPQEPQLFHRSIRENISYGRPDATDDQIWQAIKQANSTEFIKDLPEGLNTLVGERGVKLSGGQRQRIAIARAMLKDAPILVLDEATSALDSESESQIQDALWKLMEGRTAIVIAHRLSTIQKMDRIIVLDNGKIIEEGAHKELLDRGGAYAKLWTRQSGGFIEE